MLPLITGAGDEKEESKYTPPGGTNHHTLVRSYPTQLLTSELAV